MSLSECQKFNSLLVCYICIEQPPLSTNEEEKGLQQV